MNSTIQTLPPFTKFIASIGQIPSSYLVSMTYEEQLIWLCNYLENTVIPTLNNNGEVVEELQNLFEQLQSYVNNYFDNLDVQEEINNKLDEMAENGDLTILIGNYIQPLIDNQNEEINNFKDDVNEEISLLNNKIDSAVNGSPLVASSLNDMTDITKIYVLTSSGHWYYYDGTNWQDGGVYQAEQIGNNEIFYNMLNETLRNNITPKTMITGTLNLDSSFYQGSIGNEPTLVSDNTSTNYSCGSINVNENDIIYSNFFFGTTYDAVFPILMVDENNLIVNRVARTDLYDTSTFTPKEYIYKVPSNVKKIYFNNRYGNASTNITKWYPYIIKSYNYNDNRVTNQLTNKITVNYTEQKTNKIYTLYYWDKDQTNFKTLVYPVNTGDKMNIVETLYSDNYSVGGIFVNDDLKPVGFINVRNSSGAPISIDEDFIVPAESKYLYVTAKSDTTVTISKYSFSDIQIPKNMTISYSSGILTMINNSNNNSLSMRHSNTGNNLFEITGYTVNGESKGFETDMIPSPYIVKAINNINGDRNFEGFTGGQHTYNNTEYNGTPTATEISLQIIADNIDISNETISSMQCNEVKIIETNRVQATNTCLENGGGRNVLEERIIFTYNGKELDIINTITPLEDIDLRRYYGIQTAIFTNNLYKVYADKIYDVDTQNNCPIKPNAIYGSNLIKSELFNEGLGDYRMNNTDKKVNISNYKAYYIPVWWTNTQNIISSGESQYIHGKYTFDYIQD